ncbi:nuclear transport factor 2 family protein [Enemella sp. A6]|uniref:nuclear transport factor 2 family protein n=1 Tax=Enemella sp. A6 TaxID=3440152 RepID=UPI003EBE417A
MADVPLASLTAVKERNKEAWLALFADDAVVEDPVGPFEWDPEGVGQRGKAAISDFWDMFSARQQSFDFDIKHLVAIGKEAAVHVRLNMTYAGGAQGSVDAINLYRVNDEGKVESLRSFWTR